MHINLHQLGREEWRDVFISFFDGMEVSVEAFVQNTQERHNHEQSLQQILDHNDTRGHDSRQMIIARTFSWRNTPEGYEPWKLIHNVISCPNPEEYSITFNF